MQPESEDKRIISAEWAKDEDIARFLKALPNWQVVQEPSTEIAESPQEIGKSIFYFNISPLGGDYMKFS